MRGLAAVAIVLLGTTLVIFLFPALIPSEAMRFESFHELYFFVDENGDAIAQGTVKVRRSKLSDHLNYLISMMGKESMEREYGRAMTVSVARFGFEVENVKVEILDGEGLEMRVSWWSPRMARWDGENWKLEFEWVDDLAVAEEEIGRDEVSVVMMGGIADTIFQYLSSDVMFVVFPENAKDLRIEGMEFSTVDLGGGNYSVSRVGVGEFSGRMAVIDNTFTVLTNAGRMSITPEELVENSARYAVRYSGFMPADDSFVWSLEALRLDLKYGKPLKDFYPAFLDGTLYHMTPSQIFYQVAKAVLSGAPQRYSPSEVIGVAPPDEEAGEWRAFLNLLSKNDCISIAEEAVAQISSRGKAPGSLQTPFGAIRFRDALYTLLRAVVETDENGIPENILLFPVPSGMLKWENFGAPAKYMYYLLPDTYVRTGTQRVAEVLRGLPENLPLRSLAAEICNWTGSNLTYKLSFLPPSSEDVLEHRSGQCRDYTNVYLALARTAGVPARRVTGWVVSSWQPPAGWGFTSTTTPEGKSIALHAWVEVFLPGEGWVPLEPESSRPSLYFGSLPYEVYRKVSQSWVGAMGEYEAAGWRI